MEEKSSSSKRNSKETSTLKHHDIKQEEYEHEYIVERYPLFYDMETKQLHIDTCFHSQSIVNASYNFCVFDLTLIRLIEVECKCISDYVVIKPSDDEVVCSADNLYDDENFRGIAWSNNTFYYIGQTVQEDSRQIFHFRITQLLCRGAQTLLVYDHIVSTDMITFLHRVGKLCPHCWNCMYSLIIRGMFFVFSFIPFLSSFCWMILFLSLSLSSSCVFAFITYLEHLMELFIEYLNNCMHTNYQTEKLIEKVLCSLNPKRIIHKKIMKKIQQWFLKDIHSLEKNNSAQIRIQDFVRCLRTVHSLLLSQRVDGISFVSSFITLFKLSFFFLLYLFIKRIRYLVGK